MTILRRYGRGLRIVGQTLEVDFGDGPEQVPSNGDLPSAPASRGRCTTPLLLCLRAVARSPVWTGISQTLWQPKEHDLGEGALVLQLLGRASSEKHPLGVRLYDLSAGQYVPLDEQALELTISSEDSTVVRSRDLRRVRPFDTAREVLLELQLSVSRADAPGVLERAELVKA